MRTAHTVLLLIAVLAISTAAGFFLSKRTSINQIQKSGKPQIAATIFPLSDITKNIGGDKIDVTLILPPGASPHTFDLKPSDIAKIQKADLVLAIGHGLDDWVTSALNSPDKKVVIDKDIVIKKLGGEDDPHYWLSVKNAKQIALNISEILINHDPANRSYYLQNTISYLVQLELLEKELTELSLKIGNRSFVTFHDAWYYFSEERGLNVAASFEPFPGKSPSPSDLNQFGKAVKASGTKVIYSEPQIPSDLLEAVVKDLGVKIVVLDPTGGIKDRDSYINLMRYNMHEIEKNQ